MSVQPPDAALEALLLKVDGIFSQAMESGNLKIALDALKLSIKLHRERDLDAGNTTSSHLSLQDLDTWSDEDFRALTRIIAKKIAGHNKADEEGDTF